MRKKEPHREPGENRGRSQFQEAETGTEQRKRGLEPGTRAKSQSPGFALGGLECLPSVRQELFDSELATGRQLPCVVVSQSHPLN